MTLVFSRRGKIIYWLFSLKSSNKFPRRVLQGKQKKKEKGSRQEPYSLSIGLKPLVARSLTVPKKGRDVGQAAKQKTNPAVQVQLQEGALPVIVFTLPHKNSIPGVLASLVDIPSRICICHRMWALISCSYYLFTSSGSDGRVKIANSFFPLPSRIPWIYFNFNRTGFSRKIWKDPR